MESINLIDCDNNSTKEPSLLMLNDHCLMEIFELLQPADFANLAKTCERLHCFALDVAVKFKKVEEIEFAMLKTRNRSKDKVQRSNEQFSNILSVFGGHIRTIKMMYDGSDDVFERIRNNCHQLNRLDLDSVEKLPSQHFNNLRELKISIRSVNIDINEFRNIFTSNPNIESLQLHYFNQLNPNTTIFTSELFELVVQLPQLKMLELKNDTVLSRYAILRISNDFPRFPQSTKLSLSKFCIYDAILIESERKGNLVKLELDSLDSVLFIKLFKNLEVLHLHNCKGITETTFPEKLKSLRISGTLTSCRTLIAIVKRLTFLEEFDLGGNKICSCGFGELENQIISRIVDEIGQRNIKIIYPGPADVDDGDVNEPYLYNSSHLQIIRNRFWPLLKARKSARLPHVLHPV